MTAEVSIILDKAENVLTVPSAALTKGPEGYTVKLSSVKFCDLPGLLNL